MEWNYSTSIPRDRASMLLAPTTIATIANRVAAEMTVECCHLQPCQDHKDFQRVAYCIRVPEDLFDVFFNSPYGYRGAYYRSPGEGIDANYAFIEVLVSSLIQSSEAGATPEELTWIRESLLSYSAKAWLAEKGLELCPKCEGEWSPASDNHPEILNERWEYGDAGAQCYGSKAPRFTKIRLFGAFLDDRSNEFVPARKRHRARDIHLRGWS